MAQTLMAPGSYDAESEQLRRRMAYAQMLSEQGQQTPQGQNVSGHFVAPSWTQHAANLLKSYAGRKEQDAVAGDMQALGDRRRGESMATLQKYGELRQGTPAKTIQPDPQEVAQAFDTQDQPIPQPFNVEAKAPNKQLANALLVQSRDPMLQQMGMKEMAKGPEKPMVVGRSLMTPEGKVIGTDSTWQADQDAKRAADVEKLKQQQDFQLQMLAAQNASREQIAEATRNHRLDMARLTASLRPEPMMTVLGPQGEPIALPRSQAAGMTPYSPSAAKQVQEESKKKTAKGEVNEIVSQLGGAYDVLKKEGGVTTTGGGILSNLGARMSNTAGGQLAGSVMGTKSQQARDTIAQTRPLLLNAIKNATGMSAQQMNSNAEMQLYLTAATDPKLGYEANMTALRNLDKLYGLGLQGATGQAPAAAAAPSPAAPKRIRFDAQGNRLP